MADINEQKSTTLFHDRMEPLLEVYEDDFEAFGRLMHGLLSYSIYGEVITLDDKRENCDLKVLRNMVDMGRESSRKYQINQTIKSNLRYATSEEDMQRRLKMANFSDEEIQQGIDQYRQKQTRDMEKQNLSAGLTKDGQLKDWDDYRKIYG